jgi:hypothetical protein
LYLRRTPDHGEGMNPITFPSSISHNGRSPPSSSMIRPAGTILR